MADRSTVPPPALSTRQAVLRWSHLPLMWLQRSTASNGGLAVRETYECSPALQQCTLSDMQMSVIITTVMVF